MTQSAADIFQDMLGMALVEQSPDKKLDPDYLSGATI